MQLEELVLKFRKAIEVAQEENEPGEFFRKFPTGQCGHASDLLAQYLLENGIAPVIYANGTYYGQGWEDIQSHTWLIVDDTLIDITGDQFKYHNIPLKNNVKVYVGPKTEYYELFEITPGGMHTHLGLEANWTDYHDLKSWYETILKYLN